MTATREDMMIDGDGDGRGAALGRSIPAFTVCWRAFAGGLAAEVAPDATAIGRWLDGHRLHAARPAVRSRRRQWAM